MKDEERLKAAGKALALLEDEWVIVEGQRDRKALHGLGLKKILTSSGNLGKSCDFLSLQKAEKAFVLTDLDRRGHQLALRAREELEARSIKADLEQRAVLARALRIKYFEDALRAYEKLKEEVVTTKGEKTYGKDIH